MGNVSSQPLGSRYSRQILLPQWRTEGQAKLESARALIVGLGGLGTHLAESLLRMGVRNLSLVDFDEVHLSNLHRQFLFDESNLGQKKVHAAQKRLLAIDSSASIIPIAKNVGQINLDKLVANHDLIFECTDSFNAAFLVHHHSFLQNKIFVQAKLYQWEFQTLAFDFSKTDSPCLRCLYEEAPKDGCVEVCSQAGIAPPVAAMAGHAQALLGIQAYLQKWDKKLGRLFTFDAGLFETQSIKIPKKADCPLCSKSPTQKPSEHEVQGEMTWRSFLESERTDLVCITFRDPTKLVKICETHHKNVTIIDPRETSIELHDNQTLVCDYGYRSLELILKNNSLKGLSSIRGGIENMPFDL